jgi:uncharacterized damage-inducible protein DinB
MIITTSEDVIKKDFPEVYKKFLDYLKKKPLKSSNFNFTFSVAERIKQLSFEEITSEDCSALDVFETVEEELKHRLNNITVWLEASFGKRRFTSEPLQKIPRQVEEAYRNFIQKDFNEREKFEKMSPGEQMKEVNSILRELKKSPDFFMLNQNGDLKTGDDIPDFE